MKKTVFQIVVVILLLMGCSKDELINDINENNQLKKESKIANTEIRFFSNYTDNKIYVETGESGCLQTTRKILQQGTFNGTINGYGIINTKLSKYEITNCIIATSDATDLLRYTEPNMYTLTITGTISLSQREYCTINIKGNIYPRCYTDIQFDGGDFEGTGTIISGVGKLVGLNNKIFRVYGSLFTSGVNDFKNGKINLILTDKIH